MTPKSKEASKIEQAAQKASYEAVIKRLEVLCYAMAVAHIAFSIGSLSFLTKLSSDINFLNNFFPRFILNIIPFVLLGQFIRKSTVSFRRKIIGYIWFYSVMFFVAAWIHVWPIALNGQSEVFLYVAGVNTAYLCAAWTVAAIPIKYMKHIVLSMLSFIVVPVLAVTYISGGFHILQVVISDTLFAATTGVGLGFYGAKLLWELEFLKAKQNHETSKYLGEPLRKALFEGKTELIEEKVCTAYVFMVDIRDSTNLTRKYGERWSEFNKVWLGEALDIIKSHGGIFVKSTGDGLLGAFGLFDDENQLNDIPGIEIQNKEATETRWIDLTVDTYGCLEKLIRRFERVASEHFPEEVIRIACGLDRGKVHRGVRGANNRREFDIWGDKVNTAAKLEAFSKSIASGFGPDDSLLVISPYAADFLDHLDGFQKVDVTEEIRGSLYGIRWVLVRSYKGEQAKKLKVA